MNKQSAFKALESLINKAMDYDPSSQTRVTHLAGKSLKI
jgi:ubiquinone biosynthesis protein UbiJ